MVTERIINLNPFALNTAHAAWAEIEISTPHRLVHTAKGAIYDVFVKNPYDLTIGNAKNIFFSAAPLAGSEKIAGVFFLFLSSCFVLMFYGSNLYLAGKTVEALGDNKTDPFLTRIGKAVGFAGEKVFLAGAVPLYGIFYALPKKGIENLPKLIQCIAKKVGVAVQWIFNQIIHPVLNFLDRTFQAIATVICRAAKAVAHKIDQVATWVFKNVLQPLWNHVIVPLFNFLEGYLQAVGKIIHKAAVALAHKIDRAAAWIFQNVLQPLWANVIKPFFTLVGKTIQRGAEMLSNALRTMAKKISQLANWIVEKVLVPLWSQLISPFIHKIGAAIAHGFQVVVEKITQCATWIFHQCINPCFRAIEKAAAAVGKALHFIADKIASLAKTIFHQYINPCFKAVEKAAAIIGGALLDYVIKPIEKGLYLIADKIASLAKTIFHQCIVPVALALENGFTALGNKVSEAFEGIQDAWNRTAGSFAL